MIEVAFVHIVVSFTLEVGYASFLNFPVLLHGMLRTRTSSLVYELFILLLFSRKQVFSPAHLKLPKRENSALNFWRRQNLSG